MTLLDISADEVLNTTRAVRKRLDFSRPVDDDVIRECVATAMQGPSGSNLMTMQFVVVKDPGKRQAIGEVYKQCWAIYSSMPFFAGAIRKEGDAEQAQQERVVDSATYLSEHMAEAPALVLGCTAGRVDGAPAMAAASSMGNILPGMWSFMLAARARRLGTAWTTISLMMEKEVADIVGIPFDDVQQACLTPLACWTSSNGRCGPNPTRSSTGTPGDARASHARVGHEGVHARRRGRRALGRGRRRNRRGTRRTDARSRLVLRSLDDLARRRRRALGRGAVRARPPSRLRGEPGRLGPSRRRGRRRAHREDGHVAVLPGSDPRRRPRRLGDRRGRQVAGGGGDMDHTAVVALHRRRPR